MRNLLITLAFDGSAYHGFQVQKNAVTICEVFGDALYKILREKTDIKGCSRTDSHVHAEKYCLSAKTDSAIPCDKLLLALNNALPRDIAVISVTEKPLDFHARYSCTAKEYTYKIYNSGIKNPFGPTLFYHYRYPLETELLNREAQHFTGTHDFSAFRSSGAKEGTAVRTIYSSSVTREGDYVYFKVRGNGFLYNMVRIMAGTLIFIAMGRIGEGEIPRIIKSKDRSNAGKTMPAHGLYLTDVEYPEQL